MTERAPYRVKPIAAADTYELRRRVLRDGTASSDVAFVGDAEALHLGVIIDGAIVAISSWIPAPYPPQPLVSATRLRGMATAPSWRSRGLGTALLQAGFEACRSDHDLVWAYARIPALSFYERHGFQTPDTEAFTDHVTGLPHRLIAATLDT